MLLVVFRLYLSSSRRLVDSALHRIGRAVGVHYDFAAHVSRSATYHLDQRRLAPEKALLIRVEDRYQRYLGQVDAFAEQVDPDDNVERAEAQIAQDLHPLHRFDFVVDVFDADIVSFEIVRQVLRHLRRERRYNDALAS